MYNTKITWKKGLLGRNMMCLLTYTRSHSGSIYQNFSSAQEHSFSRKGGEGPSNLPRATNNLVIRVLSWEARVVGWISDTVSWVQGGSLLTVLTFVYTILSSLIFLMSGIWSLGSKQGSDLHCRGQVPKSEMLYCVNPLLDLSPKSQQRKAVVKEEMEDAIWRCQPLCLKYCKIMCKLCKGVSLHQASHEWLEKECTESDGQNK